MLQSYEIIVLIFAWCLNLFGLFLCFWASSLGKNYSKVKSYIENLLNFFFPRLLTVCVWCHLTSQELCRSTHTSGRSHYVTTQLPCNKPSPSQTRFTTRLVSYTAFSRTWPFIIDNDVIVSKAPLSRQHQNNSEMAAKQIFGILLYLLLFDMTKMKNFQINANCCITCYDMCKV